ncbi:MAG: hypothetical protein QOI91_2578 [Solirubrobacteraceae bacterium]|nr:hypothetical protein [Solirubrobacteraceae bacterium]
MSAFELSPRQAAFAARVGANPDSTLASSVPGRVFVYVEEPQRTIRYELDQDGRVLRGDVFSRETAGCQPLAHPCVSTQDGQALQL